MARGEPYEISGCVPINACHLRGCVRPLVSVSRSRCGRCLGAGMPLEFGPEKNVRWKVAAPAGHSSPSVWGDHLFLTGWEKDSNKLVLLSFDTKTGKLRWKREVPTAEIEKTHQVGNPAMSTPTSDGERVYAYFGSSGRGFRRWQSNCGSPRRFSGSLDPGRFWRADLRNACASWWQPVC